MSFVFTVRLIWFRGSEFIREEYSVGELNSYIVSILKDDFLTKYPDAPYNDVTFTVYSVEVHHE